MSNTVDYWETIRASFAAESAITPETVEPERNAPVESKRATGDWVGLHDDGQHGLPDWRTPVHVERSNFGLDEYAATRSVPDAPQASAGDPRLNPSAYRII